jgi:hypothetical protein
MLGLLDPMSVCPIYAASDTGWKDPSANIADAGDGFEGDPENAYSDDAAVASNMDGAGDSHLYYDFGLPGGASEGSHQASRPEGSSSSANPPWRAEEQGKCTKNYLGIKAKTT